MRQTRRSYSLIALVLAVVGCVSPHHNVIQPTAQGANAPATHKVSITILVLDGKNGMPVCRESPNIWVDDEPRLNPKTDLLGKVKIEVISDARQIMISPNWGHECRGDDNTEARTNIRYSVAEIVRTGVVTLNLCGKSSRKPEPGVLIFYERPSTWKELWYS